MRFAILVAAISAACVAAPAQATVFVVSIQGTVTGTKETFSCNGILTPSCFEQYSRDISMSLGPVDLVEGANYFSFGTFYLTGQTDFTIIRAGNVLTGANLSYGFRSCSGSPPPGCYALTAAAASFAVTGGVPEPATWAMMVAGFGAIGAALRRRQRVRAKRTVLSHAPWR